MDLNYSVKDLLNTPCLMHNAKVVGGLRGLSKNVSWVHVLEIRDIVKDCVNGNEMILTTGIGFITKKIAVNFILELIDRGVSALCIETALYYHEIDKELIDIANQYDFPLIEISEVSRFVDITRELNTLIINKDSDYYQNADLYENRLNSIERKGNIIDGLRYTAEYLGIDVAYLPITGQHYGSTPELRNLIESKISVLKKALEKDEIYYNGNIAIKQLKIYGESWGYLVFASKHRSISQFELLVLNRLSFRICNETLTALLVQEEEIYEKSQWIPKWLNGELKQTEIKEKLRELGFHANYKRFAVCSMVLSYERLPPNPNNSNQNKKTHQDNTIHKYLLYANIVVKMFFTNKEVAVLAFNEKQVLYYIIMFPGTYDDVFDLIKETAEQIRVHIAKYIDNNVFIVGKLVDKYVNIHKSFETVIATLKYMKGQYSKTIIYDKLYIDRLLQKLHEDPMLNEYILDHLGALLQPENLELLNTLKVYLDCNLSKQSTAEVLFIARQTLYYRLNKITDILGKDFDAGEKRFAIEFAVHAYNYIDSNHNA